jgi:hypothetical protein
MIGLTERLSLRKIRARGIRWDRPRSLRKSNLWQDEQQ